MKRKLSNEYLLLIIRKYYTNSRLLIINAIMYLICIRNVRKRSERPICVHVASSKINFS